ncbi:hypothetical protein NM208_g11731 [Fusarium decemcellulare]|uniref:Uncharacterized protein n=1 Tax=Fusarium decemcellulare TaxID=57161 RepID=A0ACC1RSN0_9HYPO|nr:hypothetical protein NM208_g11731 [Fusarium decemcellulare]
MFHLVNLSRVLTVPASSLLYATQLPITASRVTCAPARPTCVRNVYMNKHGEQCLPAKRPAPLGYVLVRTGNASVTRRCRLLAKEAKQKVYFRFGQGSKPRGIYVPHEIAQKVISDANAEKMMAEASWLYMLDDEYPYMPAKDKREIRRRYTAPFDRRTTEKEMTDTANAIRLHILDRYTEFKYPFRNLTAEKAPRAYQEVEKILTIWRGDSRPA